MERRAELRHQCEVGPPLELCLCRDRADDEERGARSADAGDAQGPHRGPDGALRRRAGAHARLANGHSLPEEFGPHRASKSAASRRFVGTTKQKARRLAGWRPRGAAHRRDHEIGSTPQVHAGQSCHLVKVLVVRHGPCSFDEVFVGQACSHIT